MTRKNIAVCLVGRILGYHVNKKSFEMFITELQQNFENVYFFVSLNTSRDQYHIDFEKYLDNLTQHKSLFRYKPFSLGHLENTNYAKMKNMTSMFYNQFKCLEMISSHSIKFDIVMKWRTEINFGHLFQFNDILEPLTIYIPSNYDYGGVNDQIAYGNFESMKLYSDLFKYLIDYKNVRTHPETLLKCHLKKYVSIIRFNFNYKLLKG